MISVLLALFLQIPSVSTLDVNGTPVVPMNATMQPIPGFDGWSIAEADGPVGTKWRAWVKDFGITALQCIATQPVTACGIAIPAHCSSLWTPLSTSVAKNPRDDWFVAASKAPDIKLTTNTGSSGMDFFHPGGVWAERYGLSAPAEDWLFAYARFNAARPRWMLPPGGWNGWTIASNGLNGGDVHHPDLLEYEVGLRLTGHPVFLDGMLCFRDLLAEREPYWQHDDKNTYAGAMRIPGWLLADEAAVLRSLPLHPAWDAKRAAVRANIDWHVAHLKATFPIANPWYYGTGRAGVREAQLDYYDSWQFAVLVHGLLEVHEDAFAHDVAVWMDKTFPNMESWITVDGSLSAPLTFPGLGDWIVVLHRAAPELSISKKAMTSFNASRGGILDTNRFDVAEHICAPSWQR